MTEAEWLRANNPRPMLAFLRGKVSDRKLRLFACACCTVARHLLNDEGNRRAVELAERLAEGTPEPGDRIVVRAATRDGTAWCTLMDSAWEAACRAAGSGARDAARSAFESKTWEGRETREIAWWQARAAAQQAQANLLRDVVGPLPFRSLQLPPSWRTWQDGLLVSMAQSLYDRRDFGGMPILADALEEAGCSQADLLNHCRQTSEHVRGCWVVDTLLNQS